MGVSAQVFSKTDEIAVKVGLTITASESATLTKVLTDQSLNYAADKEPFISMFKKLFYEKPLTSADKKYIFFSKNNMQAKMKYLAAKKLK